MRVTLKHIICMFLKKIPEYFVDVQYKTGRTTPEVYDGENAVRGTNRRDQTGE